MHRIIKNKRFLNPYIYLMIEHTHKYPQRYILLLGHFIDILELFLSISFFGEIPINFMFDLELMYHVI